VFKITNKHTQTRARTHKRTHTHFVMFYSKPKT